MQCVHVLIANICLESNTAEDIQNELTLLLVLVDEVSIAEVDICVADDSDNVVLADLNVVKKYPGISVGIAPKTHNATHNLKKTYEH